MNEFTAISLFKIYTQSLLLVAFSKKLIIKLLWLKMLLLYFYYLEKKKDYIKVFIQSFLRF